MRNIILAVVSALVSLASASTLAVPRAVPAPQTFPLTDIRGLVAKGLTMDTAEFLGRKALRLVKQRAEGVAGFVSLPDVDFQDGTIEADVAVKPIEPSGTPGFIGITFRARPDASSYDMFYIRPGLAQADDQAFRNRVAQYCAEPGYDWFTLRHDWPWVYESHADLRLDAWTHIKIDVAGRTAKLFLNHDPDPVLVVDGLKGLDLHGSVALFTFVDQEGYFSNVRITHAAPQPITNGSDAAGTWDVKLATDVGSFNGTLRLQRDGSTLSGTWSGALGENREVKGTWRDGYVELSFTGEWPDKAIVGKPAPVTATLAGWFDGASGRGRSKIEPRADGRWTAARKS